MDLEPALQRLDKSKKYKMQFNIIHNIVNVVTLVLPNSKFCKGNGLALAKPVKSEVPVAAYPGLMWNMDSPNLPRDNSYQTGVPGTRLVIDAETLIKKPQKYGKGHLINECWNHELANVRRRNRGNDLK